MSDSVLEAVRSIHSEIGALRAEMNTFQLGIVREVQDNSTSINHLKEEKKQLFVFVNNINKTISGLKGMEKFIGCMSAAALLLISYLTYNQNATQKQFIKEKRVKAHTERYDTTEGE